MREGNGQDMQKKRHKDFGFVSKKGSNSQTKTIIELARSPPPTDLCWTTNPFSSNFLLSFHRYSLLEIFFFGEEM